MIPGIVSTGYAPCTASRLHGMV